MRKAQECGKYVKRIMIRYKYKKKGKKMVQWSLSWQQIRVRTFFQMELLLTISSQDAAN